MRKRIIEDFIMIVGLTPDQISEAEQETFDMDNTRTVGARIQFLRMKNGLTQQQLAELSSISQSNIARWENDFQKPRQGSAARLAQALNTTTDWIISGTGSPEAGNVRPIVEYVGAGEAVFPINTDENYTDTIDVPFDCPPTAGGLIVKGDSMLDEMDPYDVIIYDRNAPFDRSECLNRRCVIETEDGRLLVKRLKAGSSFGLYTLLSSNAEPITDVRINWASRIKGVVYR